MTTKTLTIGPKLKTAIPGPNARRILAGDEKYISPSYTRSYPMVASAAAASWSKTWMAMSSSISPRALP